MHRAIVPRSHAATIDWPVAETVSNRAEDGPLALARAVVAAAKLHKFKLAFWFVACVGAAMLYAQLTPPTYTAYATLLLEPRRQSTPLGQDAALGSLLDNNRAESEMQVIRSERLLAKVFDSLQLAAVPNAPVLGAFGQMIAKIKGLLKPPSGRPASADEARQMAFTAFADRVGVRRVGQSYVVEVSYVAAEPTLARRVANAIASAYLWQSISLKADAARNGAEFIQARINALNAQVASADAAVAAGALPDAATPDADARVIGAALQPLSRSAPRTGIITALGAVLGLVTGSLVVILASALDRRIRTAEDVTRATGLPCLATVPSAGRRYGSVRYSDKSLGMLASSHPEGSFAAAIRDLRTSIMLAVSVDMREATHAVALVSWAPNAGCSLLSTNLAGIIRDGGQKVTLVEADVHRGVEVSDLYPEGTPCLADALTTGVQVDAHAFLDLDGIDFLPGPSRSVRTNQLAYLGAPGFARIVSDARDRGHVILDLPPLSAAADARAAALCADAVVLVVVAGRTTSDEVAAALGALQSVGAKVIGAVLNRK